jgi:hypothetical protein
VNRKVITSNLPAGAAPAPGNDKLGQVNFGFEICSTAGVPETFTVSNFTLASS